MSVVNSTPTLLKKIGPFSIDLGLIKSLHVKHFEEAGDVQVGDIIESPASPIAGLDITAYCSRAGYVTVRVKNDSAQDLTTGSMNLLFTRQRLAATTLLPTISLALPLYFYPAGGTLEGWDTVIEDYIAAGWVILNPNSGVFGSPDANFVAVASRLKAVGVKIYGYVATNYGDRSINDVKSNIDAYETHYATYMDGYFFDEADTVAGDVAYYTQAYNHAKSKGTRTVVLNPGTSGIDQGYMDCSDIVVTYENTYASYIGHSFPSWQTDNTYAKTRFCHMIHTTDSESKLVLAFNLAKNRNVGYVYITDITPSFYSALPTYWDSLVKLCKYTISSSGMVPFNIADCVLWLQSDAFIDVSSGQVNSWMDRINGLVFEEASDDVEEYDLLGVDYLEGEVNGENDVRFKGNQPILKTASFTCAQPCTFIAVAKIGLGDKVLFGGPTSTSLAVYASSTGGISVFGGSFAGSGTNHLGERVVLAVEINGASTKIYVNGTLEATINPGNLSFNGAVAIGSYSDVFGNVWKDGVNFIGIWSRILTSTERETISRSLAGKYGIDYGTDDFSSAGLSTVIGSGANAREGLVPKPPIYDSPKLMLSATGEFLNPELPVWPIGNSLASRTDNPNGIPFKVNAPGFYELTTQTTDGNAKTVGRYAVKDGETTRVKIEVIAHLDAGGESATWEYIALFRRSGTTTVQIGATTAVYAPIKDDAGWGNPSIETDGRNVLIKVTGKAAETITHKLRVTMLPDADETPLIIGIASDTHSRTANTNLWYSYLLSIPIDVMIFNGDNCDGSSVTPRAESDILADFGTTFLAYKTAGKLLQVLGNHNVDGIEGATAARDLILGWNNNQASYGKFSIDNRIAILYGNSEAVSEPDGVSEDSIQLQTLLYLAKTAKEPFIILCFHKPVRASHATPVNYGPGVSSMADWIELCSYCDAVITGHTHIGEWIQETYDGRTVNFFSCPSPSRGSADRSFAVGGPTLAGSKFRWGATQAQNYKEGVGDFHTNALYAFVAGGIVLEVTSKQLKVEHRTYTGYVLNSKTFDISEPSALTLPKALPHALMADLYGYWQCEESAGQPLSGVVTFAVETGAPGSNAVGKFGKSRTFGGVNDSFKSGEFDNFFGNVKWSISIWHKIAGFPAATQYLFYKGNSWDLRVLNSGKVQARLKDASNSVLHDVTSTPTLSVGWNSIIMTFDPDTDTLKLHLNGDTTGDSNVNATAPNDGTNSLYIGSSAGSNYLAGELDEIILWKNRVITGSEITQLQTLYYPFYI